MRMCNEDFMLPNMQTLCSTVFNKKVYSYIWYRYDCKIKNVVFLHNPVSIQKFKNSKEFAEMNTETSAILQSLILVTENESKNLFKIVDGYVLDPRKTLFDWFVYKQTYFNSKPVYRDDYFIRVTSGHRIIKKHLLNCDYNIKKETVFNFAYPYNNIVGVNKPKTYEELLKINLEPILKQLKYSIRSLPDGTMLKELNKVYRYYSYVERVKNELRGICL